MRVCIAVATFGNRILNFRLPMKVDGVVYLIVHQNHQGCTFPGFLNRDDVVYFTMDGVGISRSRNFAIRNSESEYLYFMDDDTEIYPNEIYDLCQRMRVDKVAAATAEFIYVDGTKKNYRSYVHRHTKVSLARVSSIEICINRKMTTGVYFDERFGLGAKYPSGEEYIYLNSLLQRGRDIFHYPIITSVHPVITSGQDFFSSADKILAKKMMIIEIFPKLHFFVRLLFVMKKLRVLLGSDRLFTFIRLFLL